MFKLNSEKESGWGEEGGAGLEKKSLLAREKVVDYQISRCCLLNFLKGLFFVAAV